MVVSRVTVQLGTFLKRVVVVLVLVVVGTIVVAIVVAVVAELSTAKGTRSFKCCRYRQKKCTLCIILHFPQEEDGFRCSPGYLVINSMADNARHSGTVL